MGKKLENLSAIYKIVEKLDVVPGPSELEKAWVALNGYDKYALRKLLVKFKGWTKDQIVEEVFRVIDL